MMEKKTIRSYSELIKLKTFSERFEYLKINGSVGIETFGFNRYLNQALYNSPEWKRVRKDVLIRDRGCDLGDPDREIKQYAVIHHINPITEEDILSRNPILFDMENLITTTDITHKAIHYGDSSLLNLGPVVRVKNDTCPWR